MVDSRRRRELRAPESTYPKTGPAQVKVMRERCTFRYPDGERCVYTSDDLKNEMCGEHNFITKQRVDKADYLLRRRERANELRRDRRQKARELKAVPPPIVIGPPFDPTAPYCTCANAATDDVDCTRCLKPHRHVWVQRGLEKIRNNG